MMFTTKASLFSRFRLSAMILVILGGLLAAAFRPAAAAEAVQLSIVSVQKGQSVTIKVTGMPAGKEFRVLMNKIGTQGVDGTSAGTAKTNKDGSFTQTFSIPAALKNNSRIAIRVEATDKSGFYAYNWFDNVTAGSSSNTGSGSSSSGSSASGSGNLSIVDVEEDTSVSLKARNLPANTRFVVWFDWKNRGGALKSVRGGTLKSDKNGAITETVALPSALRDRNEIRLRLQAVDGASFTAFTWFLNADSDEAAGGGSPAGSDKGIPYLVIGAVVKNETVSLEAYNLPARTEFDVYMGKMGTQGEDGIYVDTVKSPKNGPLTATLEIPRDLRDRDKIAIRLEAADGSGYYTYNWFNNK